MHLGKAVEEGPSAWAPVLMWETRKKLFTLALAWLSLGHYGHLGSETEDGRYLSLHPPPFGSLPFK